MRPKFQIPPESRNLDARLDGMRMDSAAAPESARRRPRNRSRAALLALACLCGLGNPGFAAGLLGGSHSAPLPNLAPLPSPDTGSVPMLGSGSTPDTGT